jgi:hypothetical protein
MRLLAFTPNGGATHELEKGRTLRRHAALLSLGKQLRDAGREGQASMWGQEKAAGRPESVRWKR